MFYIANIQSFALIHWIQTLTESHTRKCIFIGYPAQYKGWEFYDLESKHIFVSNTAVFDERYLPGNHPGPLPPLMPPAVEPVAPAPASAPEPAVLHDLDSDEPEDQVGVRRQPAPAAAAPQPPQPPVDPPRAPSPPPEPRSPSPPPNPPAAPQNLLPHFAAPYQRPANAGRRRGNTPIEQPQPTVLRSGRVSRPPGAWWKVDQPPAPAPVPAPAIEQYREPDAASDSDSEQSDSDASPSDEDREENANMVSALADAAEYMQTEWKEMSLVELMDMVIGEMACKADALSDAPKTVAEALSRPDKDLWWQAAVKEVQALEESGTYTIRPKQLGDKPIGSRWVLRVKRNPDGSVERYKGRVVAQGF